ncbi:hypothetical protein DESC_610073 [Desulfosarcina cetonica]|nr:hypothetical protein DESC_610073 [Desulfosarcina cetonica]
MFVRIVPKSITRFYTKRVNLSHDLMHKAHASDEKSCFIGSLSQSPKADFIEMADFKNLPSPPV